MSTVRREYRIDITVNGVGIDRVVIDPHYEEKHADSVSDLVILDLVKTLDGEFHPPEGEDPPFSYFAKEGILLNGKFYRLVWLLEDRQIYVGVINAFRR